MAVYGIGSYYDEDVSHHFVRQGVACIGWSRNNAPALYKHMEHIKIGDVIYIKSTSPQVGFIIKAVGIVISDNLQASPSGHFDNCLPVRCIWQGEGRLGNVDYKYNVRNNTLYEEYSSNLKKRIIDNILSPFDV